MNREQAKRLIIDTFENQFDKNNFIKFLRNLLKSYDDTKIFTYNNAYIPDAFKDAIQSLERVGKYTHGGAEIDLLIVELKRGTSIERARTMQRNFIAWYLKGSRGGNLKDAGLVAFISSDSDDWRFSLVKMDYRFDQTSSVKIKEEFTPARRWSFLVGSNEKSHTAQSRFLPILEDDSRQPTLEDLENAFNVEVVTREFFEKYRNLFVRTKIELDNLVNKDPALRKEIESKGVNTVDFAKKLLGQIVFLYFLQKKGWFGVAKGNHWGSGPKDFMRKLFNKEFGNYDNFFNDILEPLFYEALRTDRSFDDHFYSRFNCKIPFLNGGLFDPINNYDWVNTEILLPDSLFSNENKTKEGDIGDGILDVFDRYNFTVNEEEPLEKEVALDPELLGKIYEKLNAIRSDNFDEYLKALQSGNRGEETKFNKEYGVYYTPREIVHYMCQEILINYLYTETKGEIQKEDIEEFVRYADLILEHEKTALEKNEQIKNGRIKETKYEHKMPESIIRHAETMDKFLEEINICDPAVGSGAFPVGMLHEIVKLRQLLAVYTKKNITSYDIKRQCIENSLYGVDIDNGAIETCKLRFWLSMIVDEEDFKIIKPLPNLDYKVVCGDSLLEVEKDLFNDQLFQQLEKLKLKYFNETNPLEKQKFKTDIDNLIYQISKGHKEFDFEVYFSEVFHKKGGFDIVIANPPYGNIMNKRQKNNITKRYNYSTTTDISAPFCERGINILKNDGNLTYIITYAITFNKDFSETRKYLHDNFERIDLYTFDRDKCRVFESMSQSVSILKAFKKNSSSQKGIFTSRMFRDTPEIKKIEVSNADNFLLPIGSKYENKHRLPKIGEKINLEIIKKILNQKIKIKNIITENGKRIWIRTSGNYWYNAWDKKPYESSEVKELLINEKYINFIIILINSSLFYFWFRIFGDGRHMNYDIFEELPIPELNKIEKFEVILENLKKNLMNSLFSVFDKSHNRFETSKIKKEIDMVDLFIGRFLYELAYSEILYIMNYDKEVRTGIQIKEFEENIYRAYYNINRQNFSGKISGQEPENNLEKMQKELDEMVFSLIFGLKDK